jgi:hypothetical protein
MKRFIGFFIVTQAIFTGIIVYAINDLSNSIKQSAAFVANKEGVLATGNGIPIVSLVVLIAVIILGLYLIISKEKGNK